MTLDTFIEKVSVNIINPTIVLMFAVALIVFLWGVVVYIQKADEAAARKVGADHIMWGLIGMFVMTSAFAILKIVISTFSSYGVELPDSLN